MSDFLEIAKQAPGLFLLVVVVRTFVAYLRSRDVSYITTLREIHQGTSHTQERTIEALDRNTEMFGRVLEVVEDAETRIAHEKEKRRGTDPYRDPNGAVPGQPAARRAA